MEIVQAVKKSNSISREQPNFNSETADFVYNFV